MDWQAWTDELVPVAVSTAVVFVFTAGLWSDRTRARRMARKWGVPEPTDSQVDEVLRYRRLRLACYPPLFAISAACYVALAPAEQDQDNDGRPGSALLIVMFLVGAVIAELLAAARTRQLQPARLRLLDVASRLGLAVFGTLVLLTLVLGLIDIQAQPHITPNVLLLAEQNHDRVGPPIAVPFTGTAVVLVSTAFVLWSARTRTLSADVAVDRALRKRSARVVLGLGIGMQVAFLGLSWWRMEFLGHFGTGADLFGPDPAETAITNWAQSIADFVDPWQFAIAVTATASWTWVANPGRTRQRTR